MFIYYKHRKIGYLNKTCCRSNISSVDLELQKTAVSLTMVTQRRGVNEKQKFKKSYF